jgi:hypothetical protein
VRQALSRPQKPIDIKMIGSKLLLQLPELRQKFQEFAAAKGQEWPSLRECANSLCQGRDLFDIAVSDNSAAAEPSAKSFPIGFFRLEERFQKAVLQVAPERQFLSSGTSGGERSKSIFSTEGLYVYKILSQITFLTAISRIGGTKIQGVRGISLIPGCRQWPDSSLAQMLAWFGQSHEVLTIGEDMSIGEVSKQLTAAERQPHWIFGTAFHFINLLDQGLCLNLHPDSILIETGGTKQRSREMPRADFYHLLADRIRVSPSRILSEYGSSELASQAYDWHEKERRFRFPFWVKLKVLSDSGRVLDKGRGLLIIDDPSRIDIKGPIITEDEVELDSCCGFKLLSRLKKAPMKGCSLSAKDLSLGAQSSPLVSSEISEEPPSDFARRNQKRAPSPTDVSSRDVRVAAWLETIPRLLESNKLRDGLSQELASRNLADLAIRDLGRSMPQDKAIIHRILADSYREFSWPSQWQIITPGNHSLAAWEAMSLGYWLGLSMVVKPPSAPLPLQKNLDLFLRAMEELPQAQIRRLPSSYRIDAELSGFDGVLVFGNRETIHHLQKIAKIPVIGMPPYNTAVVIDEDYKLKDWTDLSNNLLALGGTGCLNPRCLWADSATPIDFSDLQNSVAKTLEDFNPPWPHFTHLNLAESLFRLFGAKESIKGGNVLFSIHRPKTWSEFHQLSDLCQNATTNHLTFPIVYSPPGERPLDWNLSQFLEGHRAQGQKWVVSHAANAGLQQFSLDAQTCNIVLKTLDQPAHKWCGSMMGQKYYS